jgi:hypothetical protein
MYDEIENLLKIAIVKTGIPRQELLKLVSSDFKKGELPKFMRLANIHFATELINEIKREVQANFEGLRSDLRDRVEDTFRIILYNLVRCSLTRERLSLAGSKEAYEGESYYREIYFTRKSVVTCIKALESYLNLTPGSTYKNEVNSYSPNELFQLRLIPLIYLVYEEYNEDTELIIIQDKDDKDYKKSIYKKKKELEKTNTRNKDSKHIMRVRSSELERTYIEDLEQLVKINDALKDATFALKAPIKRIYSRGHVMMGGRLYTPLANLPDRRARIRINTLFNGNPVAEVDLKANHPSMLYALRHGKQLPREFYQIISDESGVSRDKVKWLIMKMIGAKNKVVSIAIKINKKDYSKSKFMMSEDEKMAVQKTTEKLFPGLCADFYQDMGVVMQAMEGDILLDAMCDLIDKGILSLPIYDALYVEQQFINEAEKALKASWKKNVGVDFEPFVDVDTP